MRKAGHGAIGLGTAAGAGATIRWAVVETTLGPMLVAATDKGRVPPVVRRGREELARALSQRRAGRGRGGVRGAARQRGGGGRAARRARRDIPLDVRGTAFQERVWQELRKIPPGETRSYAEIAAAAGNPKAVRAAGSANGANNVAVLIPCHRVVRSDGSLGGYAYGLEIKRELLRRERES